METFRRETGFYLLLRLKSKLMKLEMETETNEMKF